ncbi:MAG: helix-turn-helix domain-containing protein [Nakamurella sp.]
MRDAKKRATQRALATATRDLVIEHGLDAVTVEQIAGAAGVSVRTFFNYFDSKEAAIIGGDMPFGTEPSRAAFVAGGPTGDLLTDLFELVDPESFFSEAGREEVGKIHQIAIREPRVLAATLARLNSQERQTAELIAARAGRTASTPADELIASVSLHLLLRSTFLWLGDESQPLVTAFNQARHAASDLLASPPTAD